MSMTAGVIVETSPDASLSSLELRDLAGASWRQVDYWVRIGYLEPLGVSAPGSGNRRRFAPSEVAVAKVLRVLVGMTRNDGPVGRGRALEVLELVRLGDRGRVVLCPGVEIDLGILCE